MNGILAIVSNDETGDMVPLHLRQAEDLERAGLVEYCDKNHGFDFQVALEGFLIKGLGLNPEALQPRVYHIKDGVPALKVKCHLERN